jgi:hypothetical protein
MARRELQLMLGPAWLTPIRGQVESGAKVGGSNGREPELSGVLEIAGKDVTGGQCVRSRLR